MITERDELTKLLRTDNELINLLLKHRIECLIVIQIDKFNTAEIKLYHDNSQTKTLVVNILESNEDTLKECKYKIEKYLVNKLIQ